MADMVVHGCVVTEAVQQALVSKMKEGPFKAGLLEAEACRLGVPASTGRREPVAMRLVDRLIQRERKAGHIAFSAGQWTWCGS